MLRFAVSKVAAVAARPALCVATPRAAAAATATRFHQKRSLVSAGPAKDADGEEEIVKVVLCDSLEWAISSPPPIHQFDEPPIVVEIVEPDDE